MSNANHALERGAQYPYDAPDSWSSDTPPPPAKDWAHAAARGVLADLTDRRSIKNGFRDIDEDVRLEIVESLAEIIRVSACKAKGGEQ